MSGGGGGVAWKEGQNNITSVFSLPTVSLL